MGGTGWRRAATDQIVDGLEARAKRNRWLIAAEEAEAAGLSPEARRRLHRMGRWAAKAPGVSAVAGREGGPFQQAAADLRAAGPRSHLQRRAAAAVHDGGFDLEWDGRTVLALRPSDAAPTGSVLETRFLQEVVRPLALPEPVRQLEVRAGGRTFRIDFAWPDLGVFTELDGEQHAGQPVYDAFRQTAIAGHLGWLCVRLGWTHVVVNPGSGRFLTLPVFEQASRRASSA